MFSAIPIKIFLKIILESKIKIVVTKMNIISSAVKKSLLQLSFKPLFSLYNYEQSRL